MSLVTACPSCGVLFKVAPDQLLISEGWVRCGKCQTVFDAALNFHIAVSPAQAEPMSPQAREVAAQVLPLVDVPVAKDLLDVSTSLPLEPLVNLAPDTAESAGTQFNFVAPAAVKERSTTESQLWMTMVLSFLAAFLLLTLALQVVLFERNEISSREPRAKPWLLALCQPFHCSLETLKRIQSIVIDGSTFLKIGPDSYQLTLVLKNTSAADLHLPSVELTLINSLDQPLLRRVFPIDELHVESSTLLSFSELPLSFSFAIKAGELSERVSGYRVLVFYP